MGLILTPRDRTVLFALYKLRLVTLRQIHRIVFGRLERSTATNRLLALQEAGYLEIATKYLHTVTDKDRKVVLITRAGIAELIRVGLVEASRKNDVPKANRWALSRPALMHDLQVVDLSTALMKSLSMNIYGWMSDHDLRLQRKTIGSFGIRVPDGIFWFRLPQGEQRMIVLENEFARYSAKAFREIQQRLHWQYPEALVLIVCADRGHMATMCRWAHYSRIWYDRRDQLLFGYFPDVASQGARAEWVSLEGGLQADHPLQRGIAYREHLRGEAEESRAIGDHAQAQESPQT